MAKKLTPAAKRAKMRAQPEEDPEFQIAPMIDILLVLLVFFMSISTTEVLQSNDQVKLPVAKDAKDKDKNPANPRGQAIVNVLWVPTNNIGSIEMDDKKYPSPEDLVPVLDQRLKADANMRVLLRADKGVRYEYMRQILKALGTAGASNVTFSVVDKDPNATPGAAAPATP